MFRISWRYLSTGMVGHGSFVFETLEHALIIAACYNRQHKDVYHYVESDGAIAAVPNE